MSFPDGSVKEGLFRNNLYVGDKQLQNYEETNDIIIEEERQNEE